jgi:glycosyltransferase involved in cell wall biosynthesis
MPYPLPLPPPQPTQADTGGPVLFATFADMRSGAVRKNAAGAVEAYLRAFPKPEHAKLIVKVQSSETDPSAVTAIANRISGRVDIELVLETLSTAEMEAFYSRTDVVLSLHRSEGFGLPLAEAMAGGKAVVATGWSGNLEFMTHEAARQLVPFALVEVHDPSGLYSNALWAEPDITVAAQLIRDLARQGELRNLMKTANREAIRRINAHWTAEALAGRAFTKHVRHAPG